MSETGEGDKRFRSPPFPFIGLERAIERAEQLHAQDRDHAVPLSAAAKAWGYSSSSSGGAQTIAALKQFGLLSDEGSGTARKVRLTKLALRLILDKRPDSAERVHALREAALTPKIHRELWEKWGANFPSTVTMKTYLTLDRTLADQAPYSDQAAEELIRLYASAIAFSGLAESDKASSVEETGRGAVGEVALAESGSLLKPDPPQTPAPTPREIALEEGERVVFVEEGEPRQYLKVLVSGDLDEILLEALDAYVKRQKRRLQMIASQLDN